MHKVTIAEPQNGTLTGKNGAEAVKKSYPDFFSVLERLGLEVAYHT